MKHLTSGVMYAIAVVLFVGLAARPAYAIDCGDEILTDTRLEADLGPCPADGLLINGNGITLDLNGHRITGSGAGFGIHTGEGGQNITIKGPGTITRFSEGVRFGSASVTGLVYDLVLTQNQIGIVISRGVGGGQIRVLKNNIVGTNRQTVGIAMSGSGPIYVYQNMIRGHYEAVRTGSEVYGFIDENLITLNQIGIGVGGSKDACVSIRGNRVTLNLGDGIRTFDWGTAAAALSATDTDPCPAGFFGAIVENNTVSFNGGDGIVVIGGGDHVQLIHNNIVSFNRGVGISVFGTISTFPYSWVHVVGNYTDHNATDLAWDGVGTNNCWYQNVFSTSSPTQLPVCN